jgi:hypothetical protein
MRVLEGRAEAVAGTFKAQEVANTLWAYATMGWEPGAGVMRVLEGRAEALAGTFNAQNVANTLWAYATMGREPGAAMMRVLEGGRRRWRTRSTRRKWQTRCGRMRRWGESPDEGAGEAGGGAGGIEDPPLAYKLTLRQTHSAIVARGGWLLRAQTLGGKGVC